MEQYTKDTNNYKVGNISLGEGRTESIIYPKGSRDTQERTPVMKSDEQKVGDHMEYSD